MQKCRIAILPCGSHGDHQPFVPLMQELTKLGCQTQMWVSGESYAETFGAFGVDVKSIPGLDLNPEHLMQTDPTIRQAMASGDGMGVVKAIGQAIGEFLDPLNAGVCVLFEQYQPHLVIYSPLLISVARLLIDKHNVPVCMGYFYPRCPSVEYFPLMFAKPWLNLPFGLNETAHRFLLWKANEKFFDAAGTHSELRKKAGLSPLTSQDLLDLFKCPDLPQVGGWSALVSPLCSDWNNVQLTGWWAIPEETQVQHFKPSPELHDFLNGKSAPVYMGWGSMIGGDADKTAAWATEAAMRAGVRAIVLGGWARVSAASLPTEELQNYARENMFFSAEKMPHEWLLPRCSCAVIHGGAGTTGVVLRSGIPGIITPVMSDQFYWATRVNVLQTGKGFDKHVSKISAEELAGAISQCIADEVLKQNASDLGRKLRQEPGAAGAAQVFAQIAREHANGSWQNPLREMKTVRSACC